MLAGRKIVVVMPAYRAARTLERTFRDLDRTVVDDVLLVDDASDDATVEVARRLGIRTIVHPENRGYGGNQKTCYAEALRLGADVVAMVHPDYQYDPTLVPALVTPIAEGRAEVVLGSRLLAGSALRQGMPLFRYMGNRFLTMVENAVSGAGLSEYHTGLRAFSRRALESVPFQRNSDDFLFDAEILAQCLHRRFPIEEVSCPTRYAEDSSSIDVRSSIKYGFGVLKVTGELGLARLGIRSRLF